MIICCLDKGILRSGDEDGGIFAQIVKLEEDIFGDNSWDKDFLRGILKNDFDCIIVALESGKVCGYGIIRCLEDADILNVAVDERKRNQGIGRSILDEMIKCARKNNCRSIFLEVRSQNLPARCLYETTGFEIIGLRKEYYSTPDDDAYVMRYIC